MKEELDLTMDDYRKAKVETAFLLNMLSHTIGDVVGKASANVGAMAGREAARKMPLFFETSDEVSVLNALQKNLSGGFDIEYDIRDGEIKLTIGRCVLRDMCEVEDIAPGGELCKLFHSYMNGMLLEFMKKNYKVTINSTGASCSITHC